MSQTFQLRLMAVLGLAVLVLTTGCARTQSLTKAPVTKLHTGGSLNERKQVYTLRRLKWKHKGDNGRILGARYFTDAKFPISGSRAKDTIFIGSGMYKGTHLVDKVIRIRTKRKRQVILRLAEPFKKVEWATVQKGSNGLSTTRKRGENTIQLFTDNKIFLKDVSLGSRLLVNGITYTIMRTTTVRVKGAKLQRVAYQVEPPIPAGLQSVSYEIQSPAMKTGSKLKYAINWRGSALTGYNCTIGINRRRYKQKELDDLLKSEAKSKKILQGVPFKQGISMAVLAVGSLATGIGGFLALVRRDDFPGAQIAIPFGIAGGGLALIFGISLPINMSVNNDYLAAAKAYNESIFTRLKLPESMKKAQKTDTKRPMLATPTQSSPLHTVGQR